MAAGPPSGDWFTRLHGLDDFVHTFLIASGAWKSLLLAALAGVLDVLIGPYHPAFVDKLAQRLHLALRGQKPVPDAFGGVVGGVYAHIVVTQIAVIIGAMGSQRYGSVAPLVIVVGLKRLFDLLARLSDIFGTAKPVEPSAG